jgi:major intracellular serine protease
MKNGRLIPFKVESIQSKADEIPYGVKQIEAPKMWRHGEKGNGILIAILDTGIDRTHPDLESRILDGRNFTPESTEDDYSDLNGHGTHVAGTIAAAETGTGVIGVAPEAKLLICKVLDSEGSGSYESIINGLKYATNYVGPNGERVRLINMSLGGSDNDPEFEASILEACAKGIVVIVASGNEGDADESTMEFGYPACYNECVTVAAHDEARKLAYFSNNNKQVDVIAAGVQVLSTYPKGSYARLSGTSMATPHVTGAMALILAESERKFQRTLTESEIYAQMVKCCNTLGHEPTSEGNGAIKLSFSYKKHRI